MKKRMILWTMFITFMMLLTSCTSSKRDNNTVVVGFDDTFAPMGFKNEKGEIVGFDIDLAKEVFKRLGMEVKFQPIDWSMKEAELNSKK